MKKVGIGVILLGMMVLATGIAVAILFPWWQFYPLTHTVYALLASLFLSGIALIIVGYGLYHACKQGQ